MALDPFLEPGVLHVVGRHDRDEGPSVSRDVTEARLIVELAVRNVGEVRVSDDRPERVPYADMDVVIRRIPVENLVMDWHCSIAADAEGEDQLLEIVAVVLVSAERDDEGGLATRGRSQVLSKEREACRVGMELAQIEVEPLRHVDDNPGDQRATIYFVEPVQALAYPVIVEEQALIGRQPELLRDKARDPVLESVERQAAGHQVPDDNAQNSPMGNRRLPSPGRENGIDGLVDLLLDAQASDDPIHDRHGSDGLRFQHPLYHGVRSYTRNRLSRQQLFLQKVFGHHKFHRHHRLHTSEQFYLHLAVPRVIL